jgi:hypothetical protein
LAAGFDGIVLAERKNAFVMNRERRSQAIAIAKESRGPSSIMWGAMTVVLLALGLCPVRLVFAAPVAVRVPESAVQSYLVLRDEARKPIALGEYKQRLKAGMINVNLTFKFKDGSTHVETAVFSQRGVFKLAQYALHQRGPSFPTTLDGSLDAVTGRYLVKYRKPGKDDDSDEGRLELPPDVYPSVMQITIVKHLATDASETVHTIAFTPKPRVLKLVIQPSAAVPFLVEGTKKISKEYELKPELGPLLGVLAEIAGKSPPTYRVWMLREDVSAFLAADGPLYMGGPVWRIELTSPRWPR